jgi:hypothetical protein
MARAFSHVPTTTAHLLRSPPPTPQTDDLARMYRLFHRIHKGLDPVADQFKQHVESEGNKLVKDVGEEVEAKKEKEAGAPNSGRAPLSCFQDSLAFVLPAAEG